MKTSDADAQALHAAKALGGHTGIVIVIDDFGISLGVASNLNPAFSTRDAATVLRLMANNLCTGPAPEIRFSSGKEDA